MVWDYNIIFFVMVVSVRYCVQLSAIFPKITKKIKISPTEKKLKIFFKTCCKGKINGRNDFLVSP